LLITSLAFKVKMAKKTMKKTMKKTIKKTMKKTSSSSSSSVAHLKTAREGSQVRVCYGPSKGQTGKIASGRTKSGKLLKAIEPGMAKVRVRMDKSGKLMYFDRCELDKLKLVDSKELKKDKKEEIWDRLHPKNSANGVLHGLYPWSKNSEYTKYLKALLGAAYGGNCGLSENLYRKKDAWDKLHPEGSVLDGLYPWFDEEGFIKKLLQL